MTGALNLLRKSAVDLLKECGLYAVTAMDAAVGRLLDRLEADGLAEDTLIVFTSDNGSNMGHHGIWGKGNGTYPPNMYDSSVKVPFLIRAPFLRGGGTVAQKSASHCDLFPTILDIASAEYTLTDKQPGTSLLPYLKNGCADDGDDRIIEIHDEYGFVRMLRSNRWKLVLRYRNNDNELYDMIADPYETTNRIDDPSLAGVVDELTAALEDWFDRYSDPVNDGKKSLTLTGSGQRDLCYKDDAFANWNRMYYTNENPI